MHPARAARATPHRSPPLDVVVVSHTHWDREWYRLAGRFRQRLVRLVDELLDGRAPPFLLDGQAIAIEDYLAVRPERAGALGAALRVGRLEAGPWYVLADELMPEGETLARNLLVGRRVLRRLGAEPPPVLYSPDAFGHPAALPLLAQGFGARVVIVWRGFGGRRWPAGDVARWRGVGGAEALLYHLAPAGYELGANLPASPESASVRWRELHAVLAPRAVLDVALLPNGADHHALQSDADGALRALAAAAAPDVVRRGTLADFAAELETRAAGAPLPVVEGELRDSYGYTWTLQGTFGTRAAQKRRLRLVERALLRDVEPWVALAERAGGGDRRAPLDALWRGVLACLPHDTLCGCSVDGVARAMDARLDDVAAQLTGLRADALHALLGHDPAAARARRAEWRPVAFVRNPAARARGGVAEVRHLRFVADEPVGPGSRPVRLADLATDARVPTGAHVQVLGRRLRRHRLESPRHYPDNDVVEEVRALHWVSPVPGYGLAPLGEGPAEGPVHPVRASARWLDNGLLRVDVSARGRVRLRGPGVDVRDLVGFEDDGDLGDLYTPSLVGEPRRDARFLDVRLVHRGPLRGELRLRWQLALPARRMSADGLAPRVSARERGRAVVPLEVRLRLDADAPWLGVRVRGVNTARDHRLRLRLSTGLAGARGRADAPFGACWREPLVVSAEDVRMETPPRTAPLHRWVSLYGAERGVTVHADGLAEYEATAAGDVLVTLVRAVGQLSRSDLPERPGHAGWPADTPLAQSLGPFAAAFAVHPHGAWGPATEAEVARVSDDVLHPLAGDTLRDALHTPPLTHGVELEGERLVFSACAPAERAGWTMLRCRNVADAPVRGRWVLGSPPAEAWLARLDETPLQRLEVRHGAVEFVAPAGGVVTVVLR